MAEHSMPFGAEITGDGVRFRLWAPDAQEVTLILEGQAHEMPLRDNGWREAVVPEAQAGDAYQYKIGQDLLVPDPASRAQKKDVHGPSLVVDPIAHSWQNQDWRGLPFEETVAVEVHVGAATPEGTFDGLRRKLDHYKELGVTAIELLPVADFAGQRNWGYDGVLPFAPDSAYGRPEDLKRLIDDAHGLGLQVFIDVVYNHFGPDGNYLHAYAERFFDAEKQTPWGAALNFSERPVRDFFISNAVYWLNEYRFDGIRFDAVHAIEDMAGTEGEAHFLEEMARVIRSAIEPDRHVHLILENDDNRSELLAREGGAPRHYDAQWNDDFHHVVHRMVTGETDGYYDDYDRAAERLARVLSEGFAYQGEASPHRDGAHRGTPSADLPPQAFVSFIQNHDQVGNRALGDRISAAAPREAVEAATALYLLCPQIPMIWMGEEWAATSTFPFFCDFSGDLADAVREGRRREFSRFERFADPAARELIPDPNAEDTFLAAKLDWQEIGRHVHQDRLDLFRHLIALRKEYVVPLLKSGRPQVEAAHEGGGVTVRYDFGGRVLSFAVNLTAEPVPLGDALRGEVLFSTHEASPGEMPAWSLTATLS
ncbi:malto-oligosyltrehalose trehalohydrolase [Parvularcula oceani]|uniref:malto-oligosyltrehalose trehalohydrolase n=1 Tax=Parvularcula oceani TaxID=1247963 RepID=UPI0004E2813A|nr:malto-oligosyltrehalose trehalohydrolase [Parvularcula oceani]